MISLCISFLLLFVKFFFGNWFSYKSLVGSIIYRGDFGEALIKGLGASKKRESYQLESLSCCKCKKVHRGE